MKSKIGLMLFVALTECAPVAVEQPDSGDLRSADLAFDAATAFDFADACDDGVRNMQETDVDCGGMTCPPCAEHARCLVDRDCVTKVCLLGACISGGAFAAPQSYPTGNGTHAAWVDDFNRDEASDIAAANADDSTVSILLGLGDGRFAAPIQNAVGGNPESIQSEKLNLVTDHFPSIVVTSPSTSYIVELDNKNGSGHFDSQIHYPTDCNEVTLADFDNDRVYDLAVSAGGGIAIFKGSVWGGFEPFDGYSTGPGASAIIGADLNEDGNVDLVVGNSGDASISVLFGKGNRQFFPTAKYSVGRQPGRSLAVADFNGDHHWDVAVPNVMDGSLTMLLGDGKGLLKALPPKAVSNAPLALVAADFDRDGNVDVAIISAQDVSLKVFFGKGDGGFTLSPLSIPLPQVPFFVTVGDFNLDGRPDLVVAAGKGVLVLLNGI